MKTRAFGKTDLVVSEVVFGAGFTGGILILTDEAARHAALERAVKAGINWIDTAPYYGDGQSEETIGRHLHALSSRPMVSTKVALVESDLSDIPGAVERSLEQSLKRLKCDRVEVLQLHNPLGDYAMGSMFRLSSETVLKKGGVADALDRLKSQGLVKAIGMTALGEAQASIRVIDSGRFDSAQVYYNIINPSAAWDTAPAAWSPQNFSGIIGACRKHEMAVMGIRVFAGGALASATRHGREFVLIQGSDQAEEERRAALARQTFGDRYGTPAQVAVRFALASTDIACVVVGIGALEHIDDAVEASRKGPLPSEALKQLDVLNQSNYAPPTMK